jgi:protocatechuate 3,4-dioxygenase beta subunit
MEMSPSWEAASRSATEEFYGTAKFITVSTGPYPEPEESIPYHPTLFLYGPFRY